MAKTVIIIGAGKIHKARIIEDATNICLDADSIEFIDDEKQRGITISDFKAIVELPYEFKIPTKRKDLRRLELENSQKGWKGKNKYFR